MTEEQKKLQQQNQQQNTAAPAVQTQQQNNQQSTTPAPDTYNQAMSTLQANEKPISTPDFDAQINDVYNKIVNREQFAYDINADALFQQAKDNYVKMGRLAMKDTLGQAAALTGGYGSTYGQTVGQQAFDDSLQELYNQMPDYYDRAYQLYQSEGDSLMQQYGMLGDEYNRYMNERDYNYSRLMDLINASGYSPTEQEATAAGMTTEQVQQLLKAWRIQNPGLYAQMSGNTGGGGSSGWYRGSSSGSGDDDEVELTEAELKAARDKILALNKAGYYTLEDAEDEINRLYGWA